MNETITKEDKKLLELLNAHPLLRHRVEALMSIVEDRDETIEKADAAEQRVIENELEIGLINEIRNATNGNYVLGDDRFK